VSRRVTLPGADELFRATSSGGAPSERSVGDEAVETDEAMPAGVATTVTPLRSRPTSRNGSRRPSGREKHEEKITVYVSPAELVDLEHARLTLRADHGIAADRGRIVREAVAVVIADLEAKGADSILVRRLRDR
jgi:hypothetical protein